ncbi:hypothetical protein AURDEDRAFT_110747 [Auricularia subglabra TFB-10046 SS5]|nr:hypothetical protein AURDEDRAFT_110747 [Auricularia subglabra TFB-10046 SS5]
MQLDTPMAVSPRSPSARVLRSSTKRPRSPSSPSPADQPSKRRVVCSPRTRRRLPPDGASSSGSSDWVAKTHSLRLDSASPFPDDAPPGQGLTASISFNRSRATTPTLRAGMALDEDVQMQTDSPPPRPASPALFTPPRAAHDVSQIPQLTLSIPDVPQTAAAGAPAPFQLDLSSLMLPRINVQPATPSTAANSRSASLAPPSPSPSPMSSIHSPMPWSPAPASAKRRVTMGPRADCEKCRMGVKGHWMHFD